VITKNHEVRLRDRQNQALSASTALGTLPKPIVSLEWHPEDCRFLAASEDGTSSIWRADDLVRIPFRFPGNQLYFAGWCMDGYGVAHAYEDGTINLDGPTWYGDLPDRSGRVPSIVYGPNYRMVTMPWHTYSPRLWTLPGVGSMPTMVPLLGHTGPVHTATFSADGTRIATGSVDHSVRLWTTLAIQQPTPIPQPPFGDTSLSERFVRFSANGELVAFFENNWGGPAGSRIEVWDARGTTPIACVHVKPNRLADAALDEQGRLLAVAMRTTRSRTVEPASTHRTAKSIVGLFHAEDGTSLPPDFVGPPGAEIESCRFAVDGRSLLATCANHSLLVWDVPSRRLLRHLEPETKADNSALGLRWFAVHSASKEVQVFDSLGIEPPRSLGFCEALHGFSEDGGSVVTVKAPRTIELLRLGAGPPISIHLPGEGKLQGAIHASETCVLVTEEHSSGLATSRKQLTYWDLASGQRLGCWPGDWSARFTAGGSRILATDGLRIMIVDAQTGRQIITWKHQLGSNHPWPSPDGRSFAVASEEESEAWMWSTEPFAVRAQAASDLAAAKSRLQSRFEAIATKNLSVAGLRTKVAEWRLEDPFERRAATLLLGEFVDQRLVEVERVRDLRLGASVEDAQKAVGLVAAAIDDFPGEVTMRRLLGMLHYRAGRPADAVAMLTPEVTNDPETKYATSQWLVLAMAHARLGDREAALAAMERVDRTRDDARELLAEAEALLAATFPK
jgi:WD40 repeat protein